MQVNPDLADPDWLLERFRGEKPFIFFHAATVLRALADREGGTSERYRDLARQALAIVSGFPGPPDNNTVGVLTAIANTRLG